MKQAYLIIAHNKIEQLKFLVSLIDYEKHDIYILFDKKSKISENIKSDIAQVPRYSKVIFTEEIPNYWGGYSFVEAEMVLFKTAQETDQYSFYHLLSGVDLPLESAENLYRFFDTHRSYNFLEVESDELMQQMRREERIKFYTLFPQLGYRTLKFKLLGYPIAVYRRVEKIVQRLFRVNKIAKYDVKIKAGSNWCSLNQEAVNVLITEKQFIEELFSKAILADELFVQTILEKHHLLGTLYLEGFHGNLRCIDWARGHRSSPYTWTSSDEDIDKLKESKQDGYLSAGKKGNLFARKFDLEKYPEMKERIFEVIKHTSNE